MKDKNHSLAVFGAGSYGTALALSAASKGFDVMLYARDSVKASKMQQDRENSFYLKGIRFPDTLSVTSDLKACVDFSPNLLIVVPSHNFKALLISIKDLLSSDHTITWATKGLDGDSSCLLSDIVLQVLGSSVRMAAISGPTFARELAMGMPTAIALSGNDEDHCLHMCSLLHTRTFRIYQSHDFISLQLGGAVKNVIAIAAGLSDGLGFGANARTALITRGLAEMMRLGAALGGNKSGFTGLSGLGDLILTCTDNQSRNRRFGFMLGQNVSVEKALSDIGQVVEGYNMVSVVCYLARKYDIQMPICFELYEVLFNGKSGTEAASALLSRAMTSES